VQRVERGDLAVFIEDSYSVTSEKDCFGMPNIVLPSVGSSQSKRSKATFYVLAYSFDVHVVSVGLASAFVKSAGLNNQNWSLLRPFATLPRHMKGLVE
jgi:hypothetical protein